MAQVTEASTRPKIKRFDFQLVVARVVCIITNISPCCYYATLLRRRGGRILRCILSVRLSVRPVLAYFRTSVTCFRQPCGRAVSFVLFTYARAAYSTTISAAQACLYYTAMRSPVAWLSRCVVASYSSVGHAYCPFVVQQRHFLTYITYQQNMILSLISPFNPIS